MVTKSARKLIEFLDQSREKISPLLIVTHDYPDPDALASAVGLRYLAKKAFKITSKIVYQGAIGRTENRTMVDILKLPIQKLKPEDLDNYEHFALVDTQPAFENNSFPKNRKATLIIDQHHSDIKPVAKCVVIDTECGATAVIIAKSLLQLKLDIPKSLATALAYGIISDTMNLYRANRPDIIQTYLKVIPHCDMKALAHIQNPVRTRRFFITLRTGLQNAIANKGLITAHLGDVESPDLVSQVADFLLTYRRMRKSLCTGRFNGRLHISLRLEKPTLNPGNLLRDILDNREDAGGHGVIAGGSFTVGEDPSEEDWEKAEETLIKRLYKRLRIREKEAIYYPFRRSVSKS